MTFILTTQTYFSTLRTSNSNSSKVNEVMGTIRRKCHALKSDLLSLPTLGFSFFSSLTGYGVKVTESFLHHDKFQNIITSYDDNHK